ncbi:MAG: hypothetical protein Tsb007_28050 [Rhizobacter sp.]
MVRKHIWLHTDFGFADADDLLWKQLSGRVLSAKGIESLDGVAVDRYRNPWEALDLACEESMEDKRQMPANGIQLLTDDLVPAVTDFIFGEPIKLAPDDGSATGADAIEVWQHVEIRLIQYGQDPFIGGIDAIKIPFGAAKPASL